MAAGPETFVISINAINTPFNVVTGTTVGPTSNAHLGHKGTGLSFQVQHASAKVKVASTDVQSNGGIILQTNFGVPYQVFPGSGSFSAVNAAEWWLSSDVQPVTVVVQLIKAI